MRLNGMVVNLAVGVEQRTFANYEEARKAAYEDGLIPMQGEIAHTINHHLMALFGDPVTLRARMKASSRTAAYTHDPMRSPRGGEMGADEMGAGAAAPWDLERVVRLHRVHHHHLHQDHLLAQAPWVASCSVRIQKFW